MNRLIVFCGLATSLVASVGSANPAAQSPAPDQSRPQNCEGCHESLYDEAVVLADGSILPVYVDPHEVSASVHGSVLACADCHRQIVDYPHETSTYDTLRQMRIERSKTCRRCHYSLFERTKDSMHFQALQAGDQSAPTCVDCHGAHDVQKPGEPRITISERCGDCHEDVLTTYASSVHGTAVTEGNEDVPVCTDCHGVHGIADPKTPKYQVAEHEVCAKCHADAKLMEKYDLSANVLSTYLDDFHGTSNQLYAKVGLQPGEPVATCSDCHGVHDIRSMDDRLEVASVVGKSEKMCGKCHEGATDSFADAWLMHDDISLTKTPLVWAIKWGYRIMIPLIMLGLVLHILMDLIQIRSHRGGGAS